MVYYSMHRGTLTINGEAIKQQGIINWRLIQTWKNRRWGVGNKLTTKINDSKWKT